MIKLCKSLMLFEEQYKYAKIIECKYNSKSIASLTINNALIIRFQKVETKRRYSR